MGYVGKAFLSGFAGAAGVMVAVAIFVLSFGGAFGAWPEDVAAWIVLHAAR